MPDSFTVAGSLSLEHQPPEDPLNFLERRIVAEPGYGNRVRRFRELVYFVIVGQLKSYFQEASHV